MSESWHTVKLHVRVFDPDAVVAHARSINELEADEEIDLDDALRLIIDCGLFPGAEIDDSESECISWNEEAK